MAKSTYVYDYQSHYGSHADMVDADESAKLVGAPKFVVCKDEHGLYVTEAKRLDDGTADPYRHASMEYRQAFFASTPRCIVEEPK